MNKLSLIILVSLFSSLAQAQESKKRPIQYRYEYIDRDHSFQESAAHLGAIYGISWLTYYVTQPTVFREEGSFKNFKNNFGKVVFDKDEPIWNWVVHPYSGSQLYLYYRANGYSRVQATQMTFLSSTLFEFLVEIYTEPASFQDLYQTPILGSIIGLAFENISLYLLNTQNPAARFFGHLLNPYSLLWFYEGKVQLTPYTDAKETVGLHIGISF